MTDRELMQQALEALEWWETGFGGDEAPFPVIAALRERLAQPECCDPQIVWCDCGDGITQNSGAKCGNCIAAESPIEQPEQEPVAWCQLTAAGGIAYFDGKPMVMVGKVGNEMHPAPLYTTPPRREWQGLTDEEIALICGECAASAHRADDISYARAIEAKLREKNA